MSSTSTLTVFLMNLKRNLGLHPGTWEKGMGQAMAVVQEARIRPGKEGQRLALEEAAAREQAVQAEVERRVAELSATQAEAARLAAAEEAATQVAAAKRAAAEEVAAALEAAKAQAAEAMAFTPQVAAAQEREVASAAAVPGGGGEAHQEVSRIRARAQGRGGHRPHLRLLTCSGPRGGSRPTRHRRPRQRRGAWRRRRRNCRSLLQG